MVSKAVDSFELRQISFWAKFGIDHSDVLATGKNAHQRLIELLRQRQMKVLEFLVAILAGLSHLKDISRAARPLDQGQVTAEAWGKWLGLTTVESAGRYKC